MRALLGSYPVHPGTAPRCRISALLEAAPCRVVRRSAAASFSASEGDAAYEQSCASSRDAFFFTDDHLKIFAFVSRAGHRASSWLLIRACVEVCLCVLHATRTGHKRDLVVLCAAVVNHVIFSGLLWSAASSFAAVSKLKPQDDTHITATLRAIDRMSEAFSEFGHILVSVGVIKVAAAAATWAPVVETVAITSLIIALLRVVLYRHPGILRKLRRRIESTVLAQSKIKGELKQEASGVGGHIIVDLEYEFDYSEDEVFMSLLRNMRSCVFAGVLCAVATMVAAVAAAATSESGVASGWSGLSTLIGMVDYLLVALLMRNAAYRFEGIPLTTGHDILLLLNALEPRRGLARLLREYGAAMCGLSIALVCEVAMVAAEPWTPMLMNMAQDRALMVLSKFGVA